LSSRNKKTKLARCRQILGVKDSDTEQTDTSRNWKEILYELTGIDVNQCPECKKGRMIPMERIMPVSFHEVVNSDNPNRSP